MRLTLTGLSSQYIHLPLAPFCLKKAVEERLAQVQVTLCDLSVNDPAEELLARIMATKPDVLGISLYIWNREAARRLIRRVKALRPDVTVVVGGPEATHSAEATLKEMPVDYLLRGAGEESLPALLQALESNASPLHIPGLCCRTESGLHIGEIAPAPAPRSDLYDDFWHAELKGRMAYVETSRGCPFSCAFCLSGQREKVQFMPRDEALALLIRLGGNGAETIKLIDRTFNCDRERTCFLLSGLMEAKAKGEIGGVCYHLEVAAELFDEETLHLLQSAPAGLFQMEAGLQSFHPETLQACQRHTDMARLTDRLQRLIAPGNIHIHIDLIAGLPREDFETFGRSFDQAYGLHPHQLQLGFLKLIYGSRLREEDWGQRYAPDPPYEVLSTPWISYEELRRLHDCAEAVEKLHNSGRFADALALALERTGMRPFDLFLRLGKDLSGRRWSLDAMTQQVWRTLLDLGVPEAPLHDAMIFDRLATDNTGYLPPLLQGDPQAVKAAARAWRENHPEDRHPRVGILSDGRAAVAVWTKRHPVTQRGRVEAVP